MALTEEVEGLTFPAPRAARVSGLNAAPRKSRGQVSSRGST